jgi:hypothetical protein
VLLFILWYLTWINKDWCFEAFVAVRCFFISISPFHFQEGEESNQHGKDLYAKRMTIKH